MNGAKKLLTLTIYVASISFVLVQNAWAHGFGQMVSDALSCVIAGSLIGAISGSIKAKPQNSLFGAILGTVIGLVGGGIVKAVIEKDSGYLSFGVAMGFIPAVIIGFLIGLIAKTLRN